MPHGQGGKNKKKIWTWKQNKPQFYNTSKHLNWWTIFLQQSGPQMNKINICLRRSCILYALNDNDENSVKFNKHIH